MQSASGYELLTFLRRRSGVYLNRARRSVWVHGRDPADFEAARPLLQWLRSTIPTDRFLLTSSRTSTCSWLAARYPNDNVLPPPLNAGPLVERFFRQLQPLVIVCIGETHPLGHATLDHAHKHGIPVILVDAAAPPRPAAARYLGLVCARAATVAMQIAATGVATDRIRVTGALDAASDDAVLQTIEALGPTVAAIPSPRSGMPDRTAPRRMDQLARTTLGRLIVATRRGRQLDTFEALRRRLGQPETILCLGNGPSCEDPRLLEINYDALFRVNWRWLQRGVLTRPDMVFVGDLRTTTRLRGCVFGFRTTAWESEVLLRHLLLNGRLGRLEYFTYERVSPFLNDAAWPAHPTNGALMLATAVGVQPRRLILAGIDLYLDPRGRYPGDSTPENDFPQMHSREVELDVLQRVLASFAGETLIVSEPLHVALAVRRAQSAPPLTASS
jgi:hypothetical protein